MDRDTLIVVGAAIIRDGRVLAAQRAEPAALRGRWEFPGGKVDPGEDPADALVRECREELGVTVRAGEAVGGDVPFPPTPGRTRPAVLRLLRADLVDGEPRALEHLSLRWLLAADLGALAWLPADVPFLAPIGALLTGRDEPRDEHPAPAR
ncbi:8-oxo-dGTP diphosphatase [Nocardiopsis flavescens]|uniref:8-oxo-dGTP diphosphatase n=1 Tax=Nocardiopsis flavescens TaxID=758803 RepID=A0A1M6FNX0_9ACTN|nr:NUDIX domain-containing protein [Nocardiopsis flavescens]SHI99387.1 8-oxo-dGTP diphosphatase [Nocardiopsis flavescens]